MLLLNTAQTVRADEKVSPDEVEEAAGERKGQDRTGHDETAASADDNLEEEAAARRKRSRQTGETGES